ncbi:TonB family protein [Novosphingobium kaempferiae]|uniref:TonB family protein n=1 Tax=Novosphingobium kaempferiae TaxID=2896849 RepID=UPI001E4845DD|nr:TonB family protein [Novosphingobium kaempferiae]
MSRRDARIEGRPRRPPRWGIAALVLFMHVVVVAGLVRAFTPDLAQQVVRSVTQAFTIEATPPTPPEPSPSPKAAPAPPQKEGAAGAPGRKATPRDIAVPRAPVVVRPTQAPPVAGQGTQDAAGAAAQGEGTGASGSGTGTGSGAGGAGTGGGGGAPTVKIAGDINSAKDYPRDTRELRIGASVVIDLSVATDGHVSACRVVQPSPDSEADRITCRLATKRFRFRPAKDGSGNPVEAVYRWRQRWFY